MGLKKVWPKADLVVVDSEHNPNDCLTEEIIRATEKLALQEGAV